MTFAQLLPLLVPLLPVFFGALGTSIAGFLRQDGLPPAANSLISVVVVLASAVLNVFIAGKLTGNFSVDFATIQASVNILLSGSLHTLTPYVASLQSNVLAFIKPPIAKVVIQQGATKATQAAYPTAADWQKPIGTGDHSG